MFSMMLIGCGKSHEGPIRFDVHGSIMLDNQPLEAGRIRFIPQEPATGPAASGVIARGTYEIPASEGAVVGKHRVEIEAAIDPGFPIDDDVAFATAAEVRGANVLPRNPIPERYNRLTRLSVEVTPDGERNFDFQLKSTDEPR